MPPTIFLSYRRQDSSAPSRWLAETFRTAFGPASTFIDTDSIRVGDDWPTAIDTALRDAAAVLVVIGPTWLKVADQYGRRCIDIKEDWVRKEIVHAIQENLLIIPVLVSGAVLPPKEALPTALQPLLDSQAVELRDQDWENGRSTLLRELERRGFVRVDSSPLPSVDTLEAQRREVLLFDRQLEILKTALALVYRARNAARTLKQVSTSEMPAQVSSNNGNEIESTERESAECLTDYHGTIRRLLYDERAFLPAGLFRILHEAQGRLQTFTEEAVHQNRRSGSARRPPHLIEEAYDDVNDSYDSLVRAVHAYIGVRESGLTQR